jgi:myo-inositol-1(or 4)-monophosphatase
MDRAGDLDRLGRALELAREVLARFSPDSVAVRLKSPRDPVSEADLAVNSALRGVLLREGEGWLSEEDADDPARLGLGRIWIVDPIDGTKEFLRGIPEWCVSIALAVDGQPVAGGILNPAADFKLVGAIGHGLVLNGAPCRTRRRAELAGAEVLASRTEVAGERWARYDSAPFRIRPVGSVAYKLGLVAAGAADATWSLFPKHEWDVAAGVALVLAGGGSVWVPGGGVPSFNRARPRLPGLCACAEGLAGPLRAYLEA